MSTPPAESPPSAGTALLPGRREGWSKVTVAALAAAVMLPIIFVLSTLATPSREIWAHLWESTLSRMLINTVTVVAGVALCSLCIGTGLAWLTTAYRFPGRRFFDRALILPLAMPSYILAFVFIATFDYIGIVQTTLRGWFGEEVWFPDIYTVSSAVTVLTLTLYPYVYLLARSAFRSQSGYIFDAARTMGYTRGRTFFKLVLPLARPSLIAGVSLAAMEALGDFATVRFFNVPTLSDGVFRIWEGMMNREAAMEVAGLLSLVALLLVLTELRARRSARYTQPGGETPEVTPVTLNGWPAAAAAGICALVLALGFLLPTIQLAVWSFSEILAQGPGGTLNVAFVRYLATTSSLAGAAALLTVAWALLLSHAGRMSEGRVTAVATRVATLGYAMPGAVIAVGVLLTVAALDRGYSAALAGRGVSAGPILTGSLLALLYAYVVRFLAVGYNSVDAALAGVRPSLAEAARTLGATPSAVLLRVHTPLVSRGVFTAAVLVFVDVMKELPVTMLLRPFGMDTLAIWGYLLASEGFWEAAAVPSLSILLAGLLPVMLLAGLSGRGVTRTIRN
ncbi:MAG: ABC transporter permease [Alkalispirochaetaceae bacterium]